MVQKDKAASTANAQLSNAGYWYPGKYYLVEVVIPGAAGGQTGTVFNFPSNIQQINGKKIDRVWTFAPPDSGGTGNFIAPSGNTVLYPSLSVNIYFSLFVGGYEQIAKVPYLHAARINDYDNGGVALFGHVVDWSISAVYLTPAPGNTNNKSILFLVRYY